MRLLIGFLALAMAQAQVVVKYSPEPMAVAASQLANARSMGRWTVQACNTGTAAVTLAAEQLDIAAPAIPFIDASDAALTLNNQQKASFWEAFKRYLGLGGQASGVGLALAKSNPYVAIGVAAGSALIPVFVSFAQGQTQTPAPLLVQPQYPVTLTPGACFTDHRFAAKMRHPAAFVTTIR